MQASGYLRRPPRPEPRPLGLDLFFARDARPDRAMLARAGGPDSERFQLGDGPAPARAVLLAEGQEIAVIGLAPGPPARLDPPSRPFDMALPQLTWAEALRLLPRSSREAGGGTLALVRRLVRLGLDLLRLPGVVAVGWEPTATAMSPEYFRHIADGWLGGGPFPGPGLVVLVRTDAGLRSDGLALFTGYELAVTEAAGAAEGRSGAVRLALRAFDAVIEHGCPMADLARWLGRPELPLTLSADRSLLTLG